MSPSFSAWISDVFILWWSNIGQTPDQKLKVLMDIPPLYGELICTKSAPIRGLYIFLCGSRSESRLQKDFVVYSGNVSNLEFFLKGAGVDWIFAPQFFFFFAVLDAVALVPITEVLWSLDIDASKPVPWTNLVTPSLYLVYFSEYLQHSQFLSTFYLHLKSYSIGSKEALFYTIFTSMKWFHV